MRQHNHRQIHSKNHYARRGNNSSSRPLNSDDNITPNTAHLLWNGLAQSTRAALHNRMEWWWVIHTVRRTAIHSHSKSSPTGLQNNSNRISQKSSDNIWQQSAVTTSTTAFQHRSSTIPESSVCSIAPSESTASSHPTRCLPHLSKSKTDQFRKGSRILLSPAHDASCPISSPQTLFTEFFRRLRTHSSPEHWAHWTSAGLHQFLRQTAIPRKQLHLALATGDRPHR